MPALGEATLGVVTEVTVRLLKKPETARALLIGFPTSEDAGTCVSRQAPALSVRGEEADHRIDEVADRDVAVRGMHCNCSGAFFTWRNPLYHS